MNLTGLKNYIMADFKWQYWLTVFFIMVLLALHIIAESTTTPQGFLKYIQDFLPEAVSAGIGAMIAFCINGYRNKSIKIIPHVIYPFVSGTLVLFAVLLVGGVFSTVEVSISGNGDGQFNEGEYQRISRVNEDLVKLKKNIKVSLALDYNEFARQSDDYPQPVDVDKTHSEVISKIVSNEKYDIYELDLIWIPEFVEKGWIIPLDKYREKSDVRYTFWIEQEAGRFLRKKDGKKIMQNYVRANFLNVGFLIYRVDLFHELIGKDREPSSWDELVEWLYEIKEKYGDDYDGFVFQGYPYEGLLVNFFEIFWAYGGEIYEEYGVPQVNTPEAVKALNFFKTLLEDGIIPKEVLGFNEARSQEFPYHKERFQIQILEKQGECNVQATFIQRCCNGLCQDVPGGMVLCHIKRCL
jgi:maltose-binding protein MalE